MLQGAKRVDVIALEAADAAEQTYIFESFRLLPSRQLLVKDGVPVRIGTRALDILTLLVRRVGELVTKEELTSCVWPNTFVHESNLKVHVAALRRVLDEASTGAPYIATIPGRGYRFIVPVVVEQSSLPAAPRFRRDGIVGNFPKLQLIIGRDDEITSLAEQLARTRCVTIVGPGGAGKTTVAVAVAHHMRHAYEDGIRFVDFSTVGDPQYVPAAIATAVGAQLGVNDILSSAVDALRDRQLLLVLDNCEHLSSAVATAVARIHAAASEVGILSTSREPIRTSSEHIYRLPTLAFPSGEAMMDATRAMEFPAVELFVTRAAQRADYVFTDADATIVAAICRQLDGLALAIELAAGKIHGSDPASVLESLEQRFQVLSYGPRDAPLRQQAMLATLDWSYRLLAEHEATVLRLLSVFVGYFSADDAVAISEGGKLDPGDAIDALGQLVAKSLVAAEYHGGTVRYRLLESTRVYAGDRLAVEAEQSWAHHRYAALILTLVERSEDGWFWRVKPDWTSNVGNRIDDLRKAISWAFGPAGEPLLGVKLTVAAIPLWDELSLMREARSRVDHALVAIRNIDGDVTALKMKLAAARAWSMTFAQPLVAETETAWLDCIRFARDAKDTAFILRGQWGLAIYLAFTGRHLESIGHLEQFKTLAETDSLGSALPEGERLLADAEIKLGRLGNAVRRLEALLSQNEKLEERSGMATRCTLALALWMTGAPARAADMAQQSIEIANGVEHTASQSTVIALWILPMTYWSGDFVRAARYQEMLDRNNRREEVPIWMPISRFFHGALQSARMEGEGIDEMRGALTDLVTGRHVGRSPTYRCILAEALIATGDIGEASEHLDQAHSTALAQGERWSLPEIMRLKGIVELCRERPIEAEKLLRKALSEARDIEATSFELRIALAIFDKLAAEGRESEARELLETVVTRFNFDPTCPDFLSARFRLDLPRKA